MGVEITLPAGVLSEDGTVINTKAVIKEMTAKVKKELGKKQVINSPELIENAILQSCIESVADMEPTHEVLQSLLSGDRDYIMVKIRQLSFGDDIMGEYNCRSCNQKRMVKMSIDKDFNVYGLPTLEQNPNSIFTPSNGKPVRTFSLRDDSKDLTLTCRYETGADRVRAMQMSKTNIIEMKMHLIRLCVIQFKVGQKTLPGPLSLSFIDELPSRVWDNLVSQWDSLQPGIDLRVDVPCDNCGEATPWSLDPVDFFSMAQEQPKTSSQLIKLSGS